MKRLRDAAVQRLLGMPSWLRVGIAPLAAVCLAMFSVLGDDLQGWSLVVGIGVVIVIAVVSFWLQELDKRQAARLKVDLEASLCGHREDLHVVRYADASGVIDDLVTKEADDCLASLRREQAPVAPRKYRSFDLDALNDNDPDDPLHGVSYNDLRRLKERQAAGEQLSDSEHATLDAAERHTAALAAGMAALVNPWRSGSSDPWQSLAAEPDKRTEEQYREEVAGYLAEYRKMLEAGLLWAYTEHGHGRLALTVVNPTDRVFEQLQVEVYLPGEVKVVDADRIHNPASWPSRPRPFGERRPISTDFAALHRTPFIPRPSPPRFGPDIDNSASAKVEFPEFTLRPRARVSLDVVHLRVWEPVGTTIRGRWEATATNADGRASGDLLIRVVDDPLPVRELLAEGARQPDL